MNIGYKCNYSKVIGFIATKGAESTDPGDSYLSCLLEIYSNVSVRRVFIPHLLVRYLNNCNEIDNHNMMQQYGLALEKYWVTYGGNFRLETTVSLSMGITDGKFLFCHGVSEESMDKKLSTREYNNRTAYELFNHPIPDNCCSPSLVIPPNTIDDRPRKYKIYRYTLDLLPDFIYVSSETSISTLTTLLIPHKAFSYLMMIIPPPLS